MTLTIHRTGADEYGKFVKASINGDPGSWKTIFGSTWPNPLIASVSANLMSVADRGIPYVPIESSTDLLSLLNALDNPPDKRAALLGVPVDTLVVDCFDHFQQVVASERKRDQRKDVLAGADWGWLGDEMRAILRRFRVLPVHVLILGHLKTVEDQQSGNVSVMPSYQGALSSEIAGFVDLALVFLSSATMEANEDGEPTRVVKRYAQTYPDGRYGWIRDNSYRLDPEEPLNGVDDGQRFVDKFFSGRELSASEVIHAVDDQAIIDARSAAGGGEPTAPPRADSPPAAPTAPKPPAKPAATPKATRQVGDAEAVEAGKTKEEVAETPASHEAAAAGSTETLAEVPGEAAQPRDDAGPAPAPATEPERPLTEAEPADPPAAGPGAENASPAERPLSDEEQAEAALEKELTGQAEPAPEAEAEADVETPKVDAPNAKLPDCEECGNQVETSDQVDMSKLRWHRVLCAACHLAAKKPKPVEQEPVPAPA